MASPAADSPATDSSVEESWVAATVVVPTRGGRMRLPVLLGALSRQTRQDFEVVVVVDGDVDGTTALLRDWENTGEVPLRTIVLPENRGRSAALNAGMAAARGAVLVRADDDLEPGPDFVDRHVRAHAGRSRSAVVGLYRDVLPDTPYAAVYGRAQTERFRREAEQAPPETHWRYWAGNCSVTAEAAAAAGEYDERFRRYGWEDVDMGYRLHALGVPVVLDSALRTTHHVAATTTVLRAQRALHSGAARHLFETKHGTAALGPVHTPRGPWGLVVRALAAVLTEPVLRAVAGLTDLLLPRIPSPAGRKLVALCVESAGRSGALHPSRARSTF